MHSDPFLILEEEYNAYYQPYTGANSLLLGGVFSHDTMDKVGTNISVAYSSNLHACGIKALVVFFFLLSSSQRNFFSLIKIRYKLHVHTFFIYTILSIAK